jgi:opacity protein-like surface antigen
MTRKLLLAATALGLIGHVTSVTAQGVYVNGVYTEAGQSITIPATGNVTIGGSPTLGTEYGTTTSQGGQYQVTSDGYVAQNQTYTIPATTSSQTYTVPTDQDTTYNIVVPSAAPATTYTQPASYAAPTYVEPRASGWTARGVYVGARAVVGLPRDTSFTVDDAVDGAPTTVDNEYDDPRFGGSLLVGYGARSAGWGYRVELEGGYQSADVERHTLSGLGTFGSDVAEGDTSVLYGFVNLYGDVPITDRLALTAGGGIGLGKVDFDGHGVRGLGQVLDDDGVAFGYHLDAGVAYNVTDTIALEALYRYQRFVDAELTTENGNTEDVDVSSHNFIAGVRVGF